MAGKWVGGLILCLILESRGLGPGCGNAKHVFQKEIGEIARNRGSETILTYN